MRHALFTKVMAAGLILMATGTARAQEGDEARDTDTAVGTLQVTPAPVTRSMAQALNRPVTIAEFRPIASVWLPSPPSPSPLRSRSTVGRKIAYGVAGGLAGLFAGAAIGPALEPKCHCGDQGLTGGVFGALIGTAAGAWFGTWLAGH